MSLQRQLALSFKSFKDPECWPGCSGPPTCCIGKPVVYQMSQPVGGFKSIWESSFSYLLIDFLRCSYDSTFFRVPPEKVSLSFAACQGMEASITGCLQIHIACTLQNGGAEEPSAYLFISHNSFLLQHCSLQGVGTPQVCNQCFHPSVCNTLLLNHSEIN